MQFEPSSGMGAADSSIGANLPGNLQPVSGRERLWIWAQRCLGNRELTKIESIFPAELPGRWAEKGSGSTALSWEIPAGLNMAQTTVLGGICSIFTGDEAELRGCRFQSAAEFEKWLRSWYPRIDQVHDCVGIPPCGAAQILYVCEDSLFARKLARWTKLPAEELAQILRQVHDDQGRPVIANWLAAGGFRGQVKVVYSSDLEQKLEVALRGWERTLGWSFRSSERDRAKVQLMYTPFWLDVLLLDSPALIFEPISHHGLDWDWDSRLRRWEEANPYGRPGISEKLGVIGFMPFATSDGISRLLPREQVPNRGNWQDFRIPEGESWWYALNFFPADTLRRRNEQLLSPEEVQKRVNCDLQTVFT